MDILIPDIWILKTFKYRYLTSPVYKSFNLKFQPTTRRNEVKNKKKKTGIGGSKKKKARTVFADSDNSSDFISCDSENEATQDFSFSFKHKSQEKENTFDKYGQCTWIFSIKCD